MDLRLTGLVPRSPWSRAGIATGAVAATALTVFALVSAQPKDGGTAPPALRPGEVLIGTPTAPDKSRSEPLAASAGTDGATVGGMRILPTGATASYEWYVNPDKTQGEVMLPPVTAEDALRDDPTLGLHRLTLPSDFRVVAGLVGTVWNPGGSRRLRSEGFSVESDAYRPFVIEIYAIRPGAAPELIGVPEKGPSEMAIFHAARGVDAVVQYGAPGSNLQPVLRTQFRLGDSLVVIDAGPMPVATLETLIDSITNGGVR